MGIDVLKVIDALQFGFNHRRCPLCAGWMVEPNGETDNAHTEGCEVPAARAAIAELIEAASSGQVHGNGGIVFDAEKAARLAAALASVKGE